MTIDRAVEIVDSIGVIDVKYKNHSIWIENVDKNTGMAMIKDIDDGDNSQVSVSDLVEF